MRQIFTALLFLIAVPYVLMQSRKPGLAIGRVFLSMMNLTHSALTDWGLSHVAIDTRLAILDVGCGGGWTIQKMAAAAPGATVHGVDYSPTSVAAARAKNRSLLQSGRVQVERGSVSHLPFPDDRFDLVTAVETHYYWPDLRNDVREVLRVLKPSGTFIIIAESYKGGRFDSLQRPVMKLLGSVHLSADEHRELLSSAGFADVRVFEHNARGWLCVTAMK